MTNTTAPSLAWLWRVLAVLATLAAGIVFALVVAHWLWRWFGPAPVEILAESPRDPTAAIVASGLFVAPGRTIAVPTNSAVGPPLAGDLRLLGTFAESEGRGYALFRLPDRSARLVATGAEIVGGATLVAVRPDGITVRDAGGERRITLRATPASAAAKAAPASARATHTGACAIPAGFKGAVVKLNAELVQGLITQPDALRAIVMPTESGLAIRDESGFAGLLGLKQGDRVETANGIALTGPDDVTTAVLRPLVSSLPVRLTGKRAGLPQEMLLLNAGACPG